jgi:ubiquinone/menaquinone biosynthesis C-methylase UbiE
MRVCPCWMCYTFDNPLRRLVQDPGKLLGPYLHEGQTALDVGCGIGYFTIGMAKLVGSPGRVIAVDLQQKMLDALKRRAERHGLADRVRLLRCESDRLGVVEPVDFILTFWMVHEVPDVPRLMHELRACLKPSGRYLLVEPLWHVPKPRFEATVAAAASAGFKLSARPRVGLSRTALFG